MKNRQSKAHLFELTFVRHGETNNNIRGAFQGSFDDKLNDFGKRQAEITAKYIKNQKWVFDLGLTSPLSRCIETAKIISTQIPLDFQIEPLLRERDYGVFENKSPEEVMREYPGAYEQYQQNKTTYRPLNGETTHDVEMRIKELFWQKIPQQYPSAQRILLITHLNPFRAILRLLGLYGLEIYVKPFKNAAINRIETDFQYSKILVFNFSCLEDPACRLEGNQ